MFGSNQAVVQHADGSIVTRDNPLRPQATGVLYFTGQGPVSNRPADGQPSPTSPLAIATGSATLTVAGRAAPIAFIGLTPGFVGLGQVNFTVPDVPSGDHPVVLTVGGNASASNAPVLSVGPAPGGLLSRLGSVDTGRGNGGIALRNNIAYLCGTGGVSVVDVSNSSAPRFITLAGQALGSRCALLADHLVVLRGSDSSVRTLSLANPENPILAGTVNTPARFTSNVFLARSHGFISSVWFEFNVGATIQQNRIFRQHGDFLSVNFQNPSAPVNVSTLRSDAGNPASSNESPFFSQVALNDDTLLLLSTTGTGENTTTGIGRVVVADVSNPASLAAVRQITVPRSHMFHCGAVNGSTALLVGNTSGWTSPGDFAIRGDVTLTTLDVSDPRNPRVVASVVTAVKNTFTSPSCVSLGGGYFAAAAFDRPEDATDTSITVIDARDANNPSIAGSVDLPSLAEGGLAVAGDKLFAATSAGLTVFQIGAR